MIGNPQLILQSLVASASESSDRGRINFKEKEIKRPLTKLIWFRLPKLPETDGGLISEI